MDNQTKFNRRAPNGNILDTRTRTSGRPQPKGDPNQSTGGPKAKHAQNYRGNSKRKNHPRESQNDPSGALEPAVLSAPANPFPRPSRPSRFMLQQAEPHQIAERKVKSLLNKLTMENFESISDQIIDWANRSEQEKDGSTLIQVIKLVFDKAKDEAAFSEMYARLCRKMMESVSPNIQDDTTRNPEGQPITGGLLFRRYLLNRCQEDFERGWSAKEAAAALIASRTNADVVAETTSSTNGEVALYSDEYYAAAKAKRQGLGLIRFIGELFKLQMLTTRIMHECIIKLLSDVANPEEEEIESLCQLLATVGQILDTPDGKNHMDIYFAQIIEMIEANNINPRMKFMLQDSIELRQRGWQARSTTAIPRGQTKRIAVTSNPGSQIWENTGVHNQKFSRQSTSRLNPKTPAFSMPAGVFNPNDNLKRTSPILNKTHAPGKGELKQQNTAPSKMGSNANGSITPDIARMEISSQTGAMSISRSACIPKSGMEVQPAELPAVDEETLCEGLNSLAIHRPGPAENSNTGDLPDAAAAAVTQNLVSEADIERRVNEDIKEYLAVENVEEAIMALETLPVEHRQVFVDKIVNAALDGGARVVLLVEKLFCALRQKRICSAEAFERGLLPTVSVIGDLCIDVPKAPEWLARIMHAAGIEAPSACGGPELPPGASLPRRDDNASFQPLDPGPAPHDKISQDKVKLGNNAPNGEQTGGAGAGGYRAGSTDVSSRQPNSSVEQEQKDASIRARQESPMIALRCFNNWVKSAFILKFGRRPLTQSAGSIDGSMVSGKVLDLGCAKGGDMNKWGNAMIKEYIGIDILDKNIVEARRRHAKLHPSQRFDAAFYSFDYFNGHISAIIPPERLSTPFDVVSMQFRLQYAFESMDKANTVLKNVSEYLRKGGVFLGTIPNSDFLLSKLNELETNEFSFGNSVYRVRFDSKQQQPVYGHKYWFNLFDTIEEVPEYVVRWDELKTLAFKHGLKAVYRSEFRDFFMNGRQDPELKRLLRKMKVVDQQGNSHMTREQWQAANFYIAFAFEKI